jgi:hypothetical protein
MGGGSADDASDQGDDEGGEDRVDAPRRKTQPWPRRHAPCGARRQDAAPAAAEQAAQAGGCQSQCSHHHPSGVSRRRVLYRIKRRPRFGDRQATLFHPLHDGIDPPKDRHADVHSGNAIANLGTERAAADERDKQAFIADGGMRLETERRRKALDGRQRLFRVSAVRQQKASHLQRKMGDLLNRRGCCRCYQMVSTRNTAAAWARIVRQASASWRRSMP